jgi:hypothetical protein
MNLGFGRDFADRGFALFQQHLVDFSLVIGKSQIVEKFGVQGKSAISVSGERRGY